MPIAIITGSAGLIGAEAVRFFADRGFAVVGIDNDMRKYFFGAEASTDWSRRQLEMTVPDYRHCCPYPQRRSHRSDLPGIQQRHPNCDSHCRAALP